MANSWNTPGLTQPIQKDVPDMQKKFAALVKQDPTSISDIPVGAKRLFKVSANNWQIQEYNGSSWIALTKLSHDADMVDGYHAAITPNANTIAVRGPDKKLQGDITGNAATASSAATLRETLPVNKGGTGGTTSAAARTNLGVPPISHASSSTSYGLGTDTNYGHVRSDGSTTKIAAGEVVVKDVAIGGRIGNLASARGQIGDCAAAVASVKDFNSYKESGTYWFVTSVAAACANSPTTLGGHLVVHAAATHNYIQQVYFVYSGAYVYKRTCNNGVWGAWTYFIFSNNTATTAAYGITKLTSAVNSTSEVLAATAKAVKTAYDKAVAAYNRAAAIVVATASKAGIVKPSTGLTIATDGTLTVSLNNTVTSTSTTAAATANAVKVAYDKAVSAYNLANTASTSFPVPNFASKVKKSLGTQYTATEDGFLYALIQGYHFCQGFNLTIDGFTFRLSQTENYGSNTTAFIAPIKKGCVYKTAQVQDSSYGTLAYGESYLYFIPKK